ncbi:MAG: Xaa-Pro peptidase family protein [Acidimicrobiia bacterium]|nr:Xaa-Pro peptidase family protein [Acidimicrobiia bacterium]MDH4308234.1 Xaa-Pro peptidase family protein [Acidimicrobiia bacterium]
MTPMSRLDRARRAMVDHGIDCLLLSVGPDLPHLIGYEAMDSERLTMFVLTTWSDPVLVVPELERRRVQPGPFEIHSWGETEDPIGMVAALCGRPTVAAIGDTTRAAFLTELLAYLPATTFVPASGVLRSLRSIKDAAEVEALRDVADAIDRVMNRIPTDVAFIGRQERDIARDLVEMMLEEGHDVASFWIVAAGANAASPHHEPGTSIVKPGDAIVVDIGGRRNGYCSDSTRTFVAGTPGQDLVEVHAVVADARSAACEMARAGVSAASVDQAARDVIDAAGHGEAFIHRLGHGIGREGHEHPYLVAGNHELLQPGNAFSIEPGIYLEERFGVRIEDIVVIGPEGAVEVLNNSDRSLIEVG